MWSGGLGQTLVPRYCFPQSEWNYVWQRLIELDPEDGVLVSLAERWLRGERPEAAAKAVKRKLRGLNSGN